MVDTTMAATAASPEYAMLGCDPCNQELPQNEILRELNFGRFITLSSTTVAGTGAHAGIAKSVVMPLQLINALLPATDRSEGRAPIEALESARPAALGEDAPTVAIANIGHLIASRQAQVGKARVDLALSADAIAKLLYGGTVVVPAIGARGVSAVRLDAAAAKDAMRVPLADEHDVHEVGAFLAEPAVIASNGESIPVTLTPANVTDLLHHRSTEVKAAGRTLTLVPRANPAPEGLESRSQAMTAVRFEARDGRPIRIVSTPAPGTESTGVAVPPPYVETTVPPEQVAPEAAPAPPQLGFYVPYLQTWKLLGYSRGALLNTIALAPQEETTIELFTWDRNTRALEQTSSSEVEQNIESTDTTKDTTQVASELTHDSNFKADAHTHVQVNVEMVEAGGDAGAEIGGAAKDIAKKTTDMIHESTRKATLRVRASRQSKVSETREFGSEQRTTRKIKNVNMCRSLNLDYFEVLVNYRISTICRRQEAQLVVLLDLPTQYDWTKRETIRRHEPSLKNALLDRAYVAGFEASRLLAARDEAFEAVCEKSVCDDEGDPLTSMSSQLEDLRAAAHAVLTTTQSLLGYAGTTNASWALLMAAPPNPNAPIPDPFTDTAARLHRWLFLQLIATKAPAVWSGLRSMAGAGFPPDPAALSVQKIKALHALATPSGTTATPLADIMTLDQAGKQILKDALHPIARALYKGISKSMLDGMSASAILIPDPIVAGITFLINQFVGAALGEGVEELAAQLGIAALDAKYSLSAVDDMGLIGSIAAFADAYADWQEANADLLKHTEAVATALDTLANDRNDQLRNAYPLSSVAEAREREDALMMHLDENDNYYSFAVYQAQLTSGSATLPQLVTMSGGLISTNAMGMVKGKLAFPVNLDDLPTSASPTTIEALRDWFDLRIRNNPELDAGPAPTTVSLPTPGISLETRLGCCDGCEDFILETRAIELRQRAALADQAESEARRFAARLDATKPDLDDPTPNEHDGMLSVRLIQDQPGRPTP